MFGALCSAKERKQRGEALLRVQLGVGHRRNGEECDEMQQNGCGRTNGATQSNLCL